MPDQQHNPPASNAPSWQKCTLECCPAFRTMQERAAEANAFSRRPWHGCENAGEQRKRRMVKNENTKLAY